MNPAEYRQMIEDGGAEYAPGFRALLVTAYITASSSAALLMMVYRPECEPVLSLPVKGGRMPPFSGIIIQS